jgi:signal transduction histidine kinase
MNSGEVSGMLPFSRLKIVSVTGRAVVPSHYLAFHVTHFEEMFHRLPELVRRLVGLLADRVRNVTRQEQQHEKLAALGKLSAGLAHELNNPSAAARRSAAALRDCLARLRSAARSTTIGPEDCGKLAQAEEEIRSSLKPAQFKDEFARVDREEAIQSWLESQNVAEPWKLAPNLAEANLTDADLARFAAAAGASVGPELTRFATLVEMDRIAEELENSSARISDLIKAIKEYSYMDQGPMQEVDIERGIETTLTMMHHKLKRGITITRDFAPNLPKVMANGSELNQVWTNLIDNAADAMNGNGNLTIRTARENDFCPRRDCRQRLWNSCRRTIPHLRAVFHHQGSRQGHRAWARCCEPHQQECGRPDQRQVRSWRDAFSSPHSHSACKVIGSCESHV